MRSTPKIIALLAFASCSASSGRQHVSFARLAFDMPGDWSNKDSSRRGVSTAVWTPDANDAKESITVIRTELATPLAHAGSPTLDGVLASAVAGLPQGRASTAFPIITKNGLQGVRVDVDYVPPAAHAVYHRVHVVFIDHEKSSLIHVLYTAKDPDKSLEVLNLVIDSLREGEG